MTKSEKSLLTACSWDDEKCREKIQQKSSLHESFWMWNFKLSFWRYIEKISSWNKEPSFDYFWRISYFAVKVNFSVWTSNKHFTCFTKEISLSCSHKAYFNSLKWKLKIEKRKELTHAQPTPVSLLWKFLIKQFNFGCNAWQNLSRFGIQEHEINKKAR